jgi:O-antigen ligase
MLNKLHNEWRNAIIFILLAALMAALFTSRGILSTVTIIFIIYSFLHNDIKSQFRVFFQTPLLWSMSLLFVVPLVSGLWSEDKEQWLAILRIKLPLLLMPLAFAAPFTLSPRQWEWLAQVFIILVTIATAWSMFHYAGDMKAINEGYLKSRMIVTPLENDHVRFSWMVAAAVLVAGWLFIQKRKEKHILSWILPVIMLWLIVFLHVLAARTGLVSFYILLAGLGLWLIFRQKNWKHAVLLVAVLLLLPVAAYFMLPSFHNRVKYIRYDFEYFRKAQYLPGTNDAIRIVSLKAGWKVLQEHPALGAGFGDMYAQVNKQYDLLYPGMYAGDKILPSSQWLVYGSGAGWLGLIIFTFVMIVPFFTGMKEKLLWWLLNATLAFSFLFDVGLEVQFGVFVYSFMVCWWWKILK